MEEMNVTMNLLAESARNLKEIAEELERNVSFFNIQMYKEVKQMMMKINYNNNFSL